VSNTGQLYYLIDTKSGEEIMHLLCNRKGRYASIFTVVLCAVLLIMAGCGGKSEPKQKQIKVAFLTNNASSFWSIARAGVIKGEADFDVHCEFLMPSQGTAEEQARMMETLIVKGVSGVAISPNDAANQIDMINSACRAMNVICHDSDASGSKRLCYVGTNNYKAGIEAGKQIKAVLPDGGSLMIFVGRMDAQNAIERRQGIIDELSGKKIESPPTGAITAGKYSILDTRTDLTDRARAKQNVEDTMISYPDIGCLVGLWSYNGPAILSAVLDARKEGKVKIVCFDEEDDTLQGIIDGHISATVVQQPYEFGYQSMRVLAGLARGDKTVVPANKIVDVPVKVIKKDNARDFWDNLKSLKSASGPKSASAK
jgi:ribose transport system substrate-binding protein